MKSQSWVSGKRGLQGKQFLLISMVQEHFCLKPKLGSGIGSWHHHRLSGIFEDQRSPPLTGYRASSLSQVGLHTTNSDLVKSNDLTLWWPLWLQGAQLRGTGDWQQPSVFSCWLSISRRLLDRIPSDISGFFSKLVCVCVNVTRQKLFPPLLYGREAKKDQFKRAV